MWLHASCECILKQWHMGAYLIRVHTVKSVCIFRENSIIGDRDMLCMCGVVVAAAEKSGNSWKWRYVSDLCDNFLHFSGVIIGNFLQNHSGNH